MTNVQFDSIDEYKDIEILSMYKDKVIKGTENHDKIYAYLRSYKDKKLLVVTDFSNQHVPFELPENVLFEKGDKLIGNYDTLESEDPRFFTLKPYEVRVYKGF